MASFRPEPHDTYACPTDSQLPVMLAPGKNQFCRYLDEKGGDCPEYAICSKPLGDGDIYICCASRCRDKKSPSCPGNAAPEPSLTGAVNCSSNPSICGYGYHCVTSEDGTATRLCCSQSIQSVSCNN